MKKIPQIVAMVFAALSAGVCAQQSGLPAYTVQNPNVSIGTDGTASFAGNVASGQMNGVVTVTPSASMGTQIDSACASLHGAYGVLDVPPTAPSGSASSYYPNLLGGNCGLWDWRTQQGRPNMVGQPKSTIFGGPLFQSRFTKQLSPTTYTNETGFTFFTDSAAGGIQTNMQYQSTSSALNVTERNNTIGQVYGLNLQGYDAGNGDFANLFSSAVCNGGPQFFQGEGCDAGRFEAQEDSNVFTATVASVSTTNGVSTLTFSGQTNPFVMGEQKILLDTTSGDVDTTGTITSISNAPGAPVVTGSGTNWSGFCPNGQAFFALDSAQASYLNIPYIVPVASITSNTSLTLNYQLVTYAGTATWPNTLGTSGSYHLYCGEFIQTDTYSGTLNQVTTADACVIPQTAGTAYVPPVEAYSGCNSSVSGPFSAGTNVAIYPDYNVYMRPVQINGGKLYEDYTGSILTVGDVSPGTLGDETWYSWADIGTGAGSAEYGMVIGGTGFATAYGIYVKGIEQGRPAIGVFTSNSAQYQKYVEGAATDGTKAGWELDRTNDMLLPYGTGILLQASGKTDTQSGGSITINPALGDVEVTLTANVSTVTVTSFVAGEHFVTHICQSATGGYTWAWPSSFHGATAVGSTASLCTDQEWRVNLAGTTAYAVAPGVQNE